MSVVALTTLTTRVRTKADMALSPSGENNSVVTDSEIHQFLNEGISSLLDLVHNQNSEYYLASTDITTVANTDDYDLPQNFYQARGVDIVISTGDSVTLIPFNFQERNQYRAPFYPLQSDSRYSYKYRLIGAQWPNPQQIRFTPTPDAGQTIRVWYTPTLNTLGADSDGYTAHFEFFNGWEEYPICYAAIECLAKEESSTTRLERRLAQLEERISIASGRRDTGQPARVTDVNRDLYYE